MSLAVLIAFVPACSGGGSASNSTTTTTTVASTDAFPAETAGPVGTPPAPAPVTPAVAHQPEPLAAESAAKLTGQILVGTSVSTDRTLHGVGAQFAASMTAVTAGMLVGNVPSASNATVTWSQETPDGESVLFTQQTSLRPHSVLFATALGIAPVSAGVYRVHVSAAGDEHDALFVVVPAVLSSATPPTVAKPSGFVRVAPSDDATATGLSPGDVVVADPPAPCLGNADDEDRPDCGGLWYSGDGGDSSADGGDDSSPPTEPPPCPPPGTPHVYPGQEDWLPGGFVDLRTNVFSGRDDCPIGTLALSAGVNGAALASLTAGPDARWEGNTCDLPGASDLFGDTVTAAASNDGGSSDMSEIKLHELGPIPAVVSATPPAGSVVQPGSKISFSVFAMVMGATRGIKDLIVTDPDGAEIAHKGLDAPASACEERLSRFVAIAHVGYKVAKNPPPILEFLVTAETFDGSRIQFPVRYSTKPAWSGTLTLKVDQDVPASGHQHMEYEGDIAVAETGTNTLEGRMRGPWIQELDLIVCPAETLTKGLVDAALTGTVDSRGMHLTLGQTTKTPPFMTPCYGQQPGLMGIPSEYPQLVAALGQLTSRGDGRYSASVSVTEPGGGYPYTVNIEVNLNPSADVASNSPAIDIEIAIP